MLRLEDMISFFAQLVLSLADVPQEEAPSYFQCVNLNRENCTRAPSRLCAPVRVAMRPADRRQQTREGKMHPGHQVCGGVRVDGTGSILFSLFTGLALRAGKGLIADGQR